MVKVKATVVSDAITNKIQDSIKEKIQDTVKDSVVDKVKDKITGGVTGGVKDSVVDTVKDKIAGGVTGGANKTVTSIGQTVNKIPKAPWWLKPDVTVSSKGAVTIAPPLPFFSPISFGVTVGGPPPSGLLPINGSSSYSTPLEPISPTDCVHYPESPFCGGNPLSAKPLNLDINISVTPCSTAITGQVTVAFIKLPKHTFAYIEPGCLPTPPPPKILKPAGGANYNLPVKIPSSCGCAGNTPVGVLVLPSTIINSEETQIFKYQTPYPNGIPFYTNYQTLVGNGFSYETNTTTLLEFQYPYEGSHRITIHDNNGTTSQQKPLAYIKFKVKEHLVYNELYALGLAGNQQNAVPSDEGELHTVENESDYEIYFNNAVSFEPQNQFSRFVIERPDALSSLNLGSNFRESHAFYDDSGFNAGTSSAPSQGTSLHELNLQVHVRCGYNSNINDNPPLPTLPIFAPPKGKDGDMGCCDLVAVLLQKIQRIEEVIGVDEYPATLPASLITKHPKSVVEGIIDTANAIGNTALGNSQAPPPPETVQVPNLTRLFEWYVRRFDEIMGQFEVPIKISPGEGDTGTEKVGAMNLPNVAESIAEMVGLLLHISYNSELLVNMGTRTLLEAGQGKMQGFKTYMVTEAIMEYLGFKHKEEGHKLALTFTPDKHDLHNMLKETEIDLTAIEFDDKNNLRHTLIELLQAAAITRAVHFRKLTKPGEGMKGEIMDIIKGLSAMNHGLNKGTIDKEGLDDFDRFIKDTETQYVSVKDPWGEDYSTRPKITKLTPPPSLPPNNPTA